ncbi:MAG: hypothetical protein ACEPOV_06885 [Hyphomicrobiales bacterium]
MKNISSRKQCFIRYNWPGILWGIIIFILIGIPGNYLPKTYNFWECLSPDKIVHTLIFGGQSFFILYGLYKQYQLIKLRLSHIILSFGITTAYGGATEFFQRHVFIGRNGCLFDLIANILGAIVGCAAFYLILELRKKFVN